MYNSYYRHPCSNHGNMPWYNSNMHDLKRMYPYSYFYPMYNPEFSYRYPNYFQHEIYNYNGFEDMQYANNNAIIQLVDYGKEPFALNIHEATMQNEAFRTALWTGDNMQLTLMSLNPGEDIGLEMHNDVDQFIRIEAGEGVVRMGDTEDLLDFGANIYDDFIFIIPARKWHNLYNTGKSKLKLYSIYAPPNHPHGTVHETKEEAEAAEHS